MSSRRRVLTVAASIFKIIHSYPPLSMYTRRSIIGLPWLDYDSARERLYLTNASCSSFNIMKSTSFLPRTAIK